MVKLITKTFRCTEKCERLAIKNARREKISFSSYIRNLIYNEKRVFTLPKKELAKLKTEFAKLTRLGANLNQIVRHINIKALAQRNNDNDISKKEMEMLSDLINRSDIKLEQVKELLLKICDEYKDK